MFEKTGVQDRPPGPPKRPSLVRWVAGVTSLVVIVVLAFVL